MKNIRVRVCDSRFALGVKSDSLIPRVGVREAYAGNWSQELFRSRENLLPDRFRRGDFLREIACSGLWERLMVNIGIVLVFAAFYWRFLKNP
jgi:hypothetical protein